MCRLFGFRSVIQSQVHHSLLKAENALETQSQGHPHGWGVAYYIAGTPHLIKSEKSALNDQIFKRVSGVVSSQTVLAHVRNATEGSINLLNTHPFQFGPWVFAHNGNIKAFKGHHRALLACVTPSLRPFILGDTDSELLFFIILSQISNKIELLSSQVSYPDLEAALQRALEAVIKIIGDYCTDEAAGDTETYLTFILTNGKTMIAHQGGKKLFYSTYKNRCPERDQCSSYNATCENRVDSGQVNHLLIASEPLSGENIWLPLGPSQIVGVDEQMKLNLAG